MILKQIVFKWCSNNKIPTDLYSLTNELIGYSRIDDFPIYSILFKYDLGVLKFLFQDEKDINIFSEVSKQLRIFKIQKIVHKTEGKKYVNSDLDKFSTFLQYYYDEKGDINIIEQI